MSAVNRPARLFCVRALAAALLVAAVSGPASAQYFGANKVQYRALHFRVLKTEHFDIYFQHDDTEPVEVAARLAERWWARLSQFFGHQLGGRQPLVLYRSQVDFESTSIVPDILDLGTRGLTEPWRRRILMPLAGPLAETDHILGHEVVHAFQLDILSRPPPAGQEPLGEPLPRWFLEGLAEYLTLGGVDSHTAMWLRDAARVGDLPTLHGLQNRRFFPYRWGHAFWAYVSERWGDDEAARLFLDASLAGVTAALERVLGLTPDQFILEWHADIRASHLARWEAVAPVGWPILEGRPLGHASNVGPAVSPDGRWVAFLSERLFSVDLFVADVSAGDVAAKLTDTSADPHDRGAQFIDSAGAWDRDGRRLAVATIIGGRAAISVFAWPGGARQLDLVLDDVDEIYSPTWSPDSGSIAFTGTSGGVTDLFVYDLRHARLRRLTDDAFADMQPAWEPNGRRIAFVTDRFTADADTLTFGSYRLALIDADTGRVEPVQAFPMGKQICPQWSPDGRSLYLLADWDGTSNLYRLDLTTGVMQRLTTVTTGLSGVTASSPALSVAARNGLVAFSIYQRGRFVIHTFVPDDGKPVAVVQEPLGVEPPAAETSHSVRTAHWLTDTSAVSLRRWPVSAYTPRLSLERLSRAAFSVGTDRFGAATSTGLGLVFSDLLNTHWMIAALDVSRGFETGLGLPGTAAYGGYFNGVHRWNWGAIASYVPSLAARSAGEGLTQQTERSGTALASYALDRARRIEFTTGVSHLTFDAISDAGGNRAEGEPQSLPLTLGGTSAAFVSDKTFAGPISVLHGHRYRVEVAPTFGDVRYLNVLGDYRRYVTPAPFYTLAARVLHVGRYGNGADDPRMPPLYLGRPTLVRGYPLRAQDVGGCVAPVSDRCQEVDGLLGRSLAVANIEFRFPLLRPFGISERMYGPLPIEVALFADRGIMWRSSGGARRTGATSASSVGVTLRTNLFGLGVGQLDIARPLTSRRGTTIQFNLTPAL